MENKDIDFYRSTFLHLRRDKKASKGAAPHKPILLLSILDCFDHNLIESNRIYITPELIGFFKANWSQFVRTEHEARFSLPFFHMQSEPFWKLTPNDGCEIWVESKAAMRNLGNLQTAIRYAEIDEILFIFLRNNNIRHTFRHLLLEAYFPHATIDSAGSAGLKLVHLVEYQLQNVSSDDYINQIRELKSKVQASDFEEEVAFRSAIFKRQIPKLYSYTCCVTELKIDVSFNSTTLIEACHIKPFSKSFDDTLSNGIALSPTLHAAFDAGLFTILQDFTVCVSSKIGESDSPHSIGKFHGKKIRLPSKWEHLPNIENIQWHNKNVFEKGR